MACRLFGRSQYLNQCWLVIKPNTLWNLYQLVRGKLFSFNKIYSDRSAVMCRPFCSDYNLLSYHVGIISQVVERDIGLAHHKHLRRKYDGREYANGIFKFIFNSMALFIDIHIIWPRLINIWKQNCQQLADYIVKCYFLKETLCILFQIAFKTVSKGPIGNKRVWLRIMRNGRPQKQTWVPFLSFKVQYIPINMHTAVLLCFVLLWLCNRS